MTATVNKKYKDRLFRLLFGDERYKENTLALYNALNETSYTNVDDVSIYTIDVKESYQKFCDCIKRR